MKGVAVAILVAEEGLFVIAIEEEDLVIVIFEKMGLEFVMITGRVSRSKARLLGAADPVTATD